MFQQDYLGEGKVILKMKNASARLHPPAGTKLDQLISVQLGGGGQIPPRRIFTQLS